MSVILERATVPGVSAMSRIRLLCLLPDLNGGGAERMMLYLLRSLDRQRFEITLALGRIAGEFVADLPEDVRTIELGHRRAAASTVAVAKLLANSRYDVCFSMVSMNLAALLARALVRPRTRFVVGARSHYTNSIMAEAGMSRLKLRAVRMLYPTADLVISVSQGVQRNLIDDLHIPATKVMTIHNPIDIDRVRTMAAEDLNDPWLRLDQRIPVLIAVGALRTAKGYPDLLEAVRILTTRRDVRLLIVGEGPLRESIEAIIHTNQMSDYVRLVGFQRNPYRYMSRATLFVHAAHWEGFPNVLLEAMACGVPVIATDCDSGPAEIITSGRDGVMVPVGNPIRMADAIDELLNDEARRRELIGRARERVAAFASSVIVERYSAAFVDVCSRAGR